MNNILFSNNLITRLKKYKNKKARKINKEKYYGNIEYKKHMSNLDENKINKYASQMQFRLYEGDSEAIYNIGYTDNGFPCGMTLEETIDSYLNLILITKILDCELKTWRVFTGNCGYILNCFIIDKNKDYFGACF